jgi:rhodanese-related sulfurtransferase
MPQDLRISVDELQKRMQAGEDFTIIDTRNPQAWAQSSEKLPEALRVPLDALDDNLSRIPKDKPVVAYCT